ncbi:hypothetical protein K1T71_000074, partial [Dendrolimus kikuchii]
MFVAETRVTVSYNPSSRYIYRPVVHMFVAETRVTVSHNPSSRYIYRPVVHIFVAETRVTVSHNPSSRYIYRPVVHIFVAETRVTVSHNPSSRYIYRPLVHIFVAETRAKLRYPISFTPGASHADAKVILESITQICARARRVSSAVLQAFAKRLCTLSTQLQHNGALACLLLLHQLTQ